MTIFGVATLWKLLQKQSVFKVHQQKKSTSARMLTVKNVLLATLIGLVIFLIGISHFFCYQLFILKFLKKMVTISLADWLYNL